MNYSWGPNAQEIHLNNTTGNLDAMIDGENEDSEEDGESVEEDEHDDLWDAIEMSAFADAYRMENIEVSSGVFDLDPDDAELIADSVSIKSAQSISPQKRSRRMAAVHDTHLAEGSSSSGKQGKRVNTDYYDGRDSYYE